MNGQPGSILFEFSVNRIASWPTTSLVTLVVHVLLVISKTN